MSRHIKKYLNLLTPPVAALIAVAFTAAIVYAAVSTSAAGGGAVTQFTTNWGDCRNIQNNNGLALFVPANTQAEWDTFVNNAPNKTLSSCCTANSGQACTSGANSCGQTNTGTYSCSGVCSASTPSNPAGYGNACTSTANSCGQTNSGTIQCDGSCSASVPSDASCPIYCWQGGGVTSDWSCPGYGGACSPPGGSHYTKCFDPGGGSWFKTLTCLETPSLSDPDCAGDSGSPTYQLQNTTTINGATGCHYEYECSNQTGFATSPQGSSCSTVGDTVTCYFNDSASGCSGGKVQGFFREKETYMCSY